MGIFGSRKKGYLIHFFGLIPYEISKFISDHCGGKVKFIIGDTYSIVSCETTLAEDQLSNKLDMLVHNHNKIFGNEGFFSNYMLFTFTSFISTNIEPNIMEGFKNFDNPTSSVHLDSVVTSTYNRISNSLKQTKQDILGNIMKALIQRDVVKLDSKRVKETKNSTEQKLDLILDKINRSGMGSLTKEERDFLDNLDDIN